MGDHWYNSLIEHHSEAGMMLHRPDQQYDLEAIDEVIGRESYGIKEIAREFCPDTILDIGANIGSFSRLADAVFGKVAKIVAVEPYIPNFTVLSANVAGFPRIHPILAAVTADCQPPAQWLCSAYHMAAVRLRPDGDVPVLGITAEDLVRHIDGTCLVKLDCEGAEINIIPSLLKHVLPQWIVGEWHYDEAAALATLVGYDVTSRRVCQDTGIFRARRR